MNVLAKKNLTWPKWKAQHNKKQLCDRFASW